MTGIFYGSFPEQEKQKKPLRSLFTPPVVAKRTSRYRGPGAPEDRTGVAPRGIAGTGR